MSYGNRNKSKNNIKCHNDEDLSDSEAPDVDAKYLAVSEEVSIDGFDGLEAQKYYKTLEEVSKLKICFNHYPAFIVCLETKKSKSNSTSEKTLCYGF